MRPAKVVTERVRRYDRFGRFIGFRRVSRVIEPARRLWKTERVLIRAGYYDTVYERVCAKPAPARVVRESLRLVPGHWAPRKAIRTPAARWQRPLLRPLPHRVGYENGTHVAFRIGL